ncbi:MAG: 2-succinyl-5-enolpyruvyl-6-hydroxy-3-cyclohexene-1-carboxylic-acid synthase [Clostridiales bacterium]|nr:2-succinyl-5-enolpyruvyl-6-hydroxy-3-cyclohexene-1-carboxylic-acid synthase [Clostridiales bacterium]
MTTEQECCRAIAAMLLAHGINDIVVSPGARNAPLIDAVYRIHELTTTVVADERSAAFVALGISLVSHKPVALICTSGTAVLNYSPAIAEAYYRKLPLLVITADRPHEAINRNLPQTIVQQDVYRNFIKRSFNINCRDEAHFRDLTINDALCAATIQPQGPVHINVEIPDPTVEADDADDMLTVAPVAIRAIQRSGRIDDETMKQLAQTLQSPTKVMIVAGALLPDQKLNRAIGRLGRFGNFVILADSIANLHGDGVIDCIDATMTQTGGRLNDMLRPDIVITIGGPAISSTLTECIKRDRIEHWHIGLDSLNCDSFGTMTVRIDTDAASFLSQLVSMMRKPAISSDYVNQWNYIKDAAVKSTKTFLMNAPWSDMKAVNTVLNHATRNYNIQLSNGMTLRYAQLLPSRFHRVDCNRGVSGIDGSTSTAIGAALKYKKETLLITGDMSASYDLNALTLPCIPPRFKIVVINNHGGGIFKYIKGTRNFSGVDQFMLPASNVDIAAVARAAGFTIHEANNDDQLEKACKATFSDRQHTPVMIVVNTDAQISADTMNEYIKRNENI